MSKAVRNEDGFFSRWSRLKTDARESDAQLPAPAAAAPAPETGQTDDAPELPPVDTLTMDSDFSGFLHPKVDEDLRRTALRKLFSDPHFNVMDGLDVYIDDYSVSEPIPPAMLAGMKQAQRILRWAAGGDDEEPAAETEAAVSTDAAAAAPSAASLSEAPLAIEGSSAAPVADAPPLSEPLPPSVG